MRWPLVYIATLAAFLALDLAWLGVVAKDFYRQGIGHLMGPSLNFPAAAAFYAIYAVGILFFAVSPAIDDGGWRRAMLLGAAFGFFAYATYDFTNLATLKDWPFGLTLADIAWGTALSALTALAGYLVASSI